MYLTLASAMRIAMKTVGDITLVLENIKHAELNDFLFIPKSRKNLVSISSLNELNYSIYFNKSVFIRKNNSLICLVPLVDNLFRITLIFVLSIVENHHSLLKRKITSTNQTYDIHARSY